MTAATGLSWWLDTIGRIPLLTPAEEIELGAAVQAWLSHDPPDSAPPGIKRRGRRARERFVRANLRLSVAFVTRRCNRLAKTHSVDDLIQAANMGLITAVERFDPTRGYRFSTYAYWWIRQSVNRWVDLHGRAIAIPGSHCQHLSRLGGITRRLELQLNRSPTRPELATEMGVSLRVLDQVIENGRPLASLDEVTTDDGLTLSSCLASVDRSPEDEEELRERWKAAEQLRSLISRLPRNDQRLLSLAWGLDGQELSRAELAQREGISLRRLENRLEELQQQLRAQSVQLVLVAVQRIVSSPRPRQHRRKRQTVAPQQLNLVIA